VPFKEVLVLQRGNQEVGTFGLPEALRAMYPEPRGNGKMVIHTGETYIAFAQFDASGLVSLETIVPYGASNRATSPHYADQLELYAAGKTKRMLLDNQDILENAKSIYHPE
jgi:acyl-homoserine-lactone acylase